MGRYGIGIIRNARVTVARQVHMETSSRGINIVPKRNTSSPIWTYFGLESGDDDKPVSTEHVICRTCYAAVAAKGGNTSNAFSHLKSHHPSKYKDVMDAVAAKKQLSASSKSPAQVTQPTIIDVIEKSKHYDRHGKKWQQLTDSVTKCISMDMLPIYTVEKEGFRTMLKAFDPRYELPGRKYFRKTAIPTLYTQVRERVTSELKDVDYFSSTTDMWSSSTGEPYLSYTVHFLDGSWKLQTYCLQALYLPEDHTADHISEALTLTLENWGLNYLKQVCKLHQCTCINNIIY